MFEKEIANFLGLVFEFTSSILANLILSFHHSQIENYLPHNKVKFYGYAQFTNDQINMI